MNISHHTFGPSAGSEAQHHANQAQIRRSRLLMVRQQARRRAGAQRKARHSRAEQRERNMLARQRAAQQHEQEQYLLRLHTLHAAALRQVQQAQEKTDMARQAAEECEAAAHAREAESRAHIAERFAAAVGQMKEERKCSLQQREYREQCMARAREAESQRAAAQVRAARAAQARRARNLTRSIITFETQLCDPCTVQGVSKQEGAMGQSRSTVDQACVKAQQKQNAAERGRLALHKLRQGRRLRQLSTELKRAEQAHLIFTGQHTPAAQPKESSLAVSHKPDDSQNKLTAMGQHTLLPQQAPLEVIAQTQWRLKSGPPYLAGSPSAHARDSLHCSMAASPKNEHANAGDSWPDLATRGHRIAHAYASKPAPAPGQSKACQSPKLALRSSAAFRAPKSSLSARSTSPLCSSAAPKQPFKAASSARQVTNSQPATPIKGRSAFRNIASAVCSPARKGCSSKIGNEATSMSSTSPPSTRLQTAAQAQQPAHARKPGAGLGKTGAKWSRSSHHAVQDLPWPALSPTQICVALPDEMPRTACEVQPYPTPVAAAAAVAAASVVTGQMDGQCQCTGLPQVNGSVALSTGCVPTEGQAQEASKEEADQAYPVLALREASSVTYTGRMTDSDSMLPVQCKLENMLNTALGDGGNCLLGTAAEQLQAACMRQLQDLAIPGNTQGRYVHSELDGLVMHGDGREKLAVLVSQLEADLAVMG